MSRLELAYRLLLRAYPSDHRECYEDEMVGVLLDAAPAGRRRPGMRESLAILAAGFATRLEAKDELHSGLRLAALGAASVVFALAVVALTVAIPQPPSGGALPAISWLVAVGVVLFGLRSESKYRVVPAAVLVLAMLVAGSELMGFKRSVVAVAALCLLLASVAPRVATVSAVIAGAVGSATGLAVGLANRADLEAWMPLSAGPWVVNGQWQSTANTLDGQFGRLVMPLLVAGALTLRWRARYFWAASALAVAFWLPVSFAGGGFFSSFAPGLADFRVMIAAVLALVVVGLAVVLPRRSTVGLHSSR